MHKWTHFPTFFRHHSPCTSLRTDSSGPCDFFCIQHYNKIICVSCWLKWCRLEAIHLLDANPFSHHPTQLSNNTTNPRKSIPLITLLRLTTPKYTNSTPYLRYPMGILHFCEIISGDRSDNKNNNGNRATHKVGGERCPPPRSSITLSNNSAPLSNEPHCVYIDMCAS